LVAKTLLRGLDLIEVTGLHGPFTITELARRTGVDVSIVSRTVSSLEREGWLIRRQGKVQVGPRCALLAHVSPASQAIRAAEPLVAAIAGAAQIATIASGLVGHDVMVLAAADANHPPPAIGIPSRVPVHAMAAGRAIASLLDTDELDQVLPAEPYPGAETIIDALDTASAIPSILASFSEPADGRPPLPRTRPELEANLRRIRAEGFARDNGEIHPGMRCIAIPWAAAGGLPAAFACIGSRDDMLIRGPLIETCLRAAIEPGAGPSDVIRAASFDPRA
jgi:DNA-binding IclR family transcriptional regulator